MTPLDFISRYFWLMAIGATAANWVIFRKSAQKHIAENPQLQEGYAALLRGYLVWMNIPWLVMGVGCTVGGVPSVWHYFRPSDGNPYVLAWFGSVFLLWLLGTFWLFFREGAEKLARHPGAVKFASGLRSMDVTNPALIKAFWLMTLAGGVTGVAIMWLVDIPLPALH
jgi:hypothetical protein